jgi:hypothetical protein
MSTGHGHVIPNENGVKARCGGPALCPVCREEQSRVRGTKDTVPVLRDMAVLAARIGRHVTISGSNCAEIADELERLHAEADSWEQRYRATCAVLSDETSEAMTDTQRLDWLERHGSPGIFTRFKDAWFDSETDGSDYSPSLRAAIDRAMGTAMKVPDRPNVPNRAKGQS